jgi:hypothetical protein
MSGKKFTVEFTIDQVWIDDGFDMTDEIALDMLANAIPWADGGMELTAKVIKKGDIK